MNNITVPQPLPLPPSAYLVPLGIEHSLVTLIRDMLTNGARVISGIWDARLIQTFGGFDYFVQFRGHLRRRNPSTENVARRYRGPVEIAICILALDQDGTLERKARK